MAYEREEARRLVIRAGKELVRSGLIARTWGNISARISDTQFVITPSGRSYETLTPEDIVVTNMDDLSWEGDVKPSSEKGVHAEAYLLRPEVNFVIHTHQRAASALSVLGENFVLEDLADARERRILGDVIPTAGYGMNATERLTRNVSRAIEEFGESQAVLMKNHGALCLGQDYDGAFRTAYTLEEVSKKIYAQILGEKVAADEYRRLGKSVRGGYCIHVHSPYVCRMSRRGTSMRPYLDDLAQIAGTRIRCVPNHASGRVIRRAIGSGTAVFMKDNGAYVIAKDQDEAEAVCLVLEKACMAAVLGITMGVPPVDRRSAAKDRRMYVQSYSRLRDEPKTKS